MKVIECHALIVMVTAIENNLSGEVAESRNYGSK